MPKTIHRYREDAAYKKLRSFGIETLSMQVSVSL